MNILWKDLGSGGDISGYLSDPKDKTSTYEIDKYSLAPNNYTYQVEVSIAEDPEQTSQLIIDFEIQVSPLQVYIKGGNKMHGYSSPLTIEGIAKDIDVPLEF